jgi:DNA-binding CsgD family transcriptional regulator
MTREQWKQVLQKLPKGLSQIEICARVGCSPAAAHNWTKAHGYKTTNGMKLAWQLRRQQGALAKRWKSVNWKQSDTRIAKRLGVSRQVVSRHRNRIKNTVDSLTSSPYVSNL